MTHSSRLASSSANKCAGCCSRMSMAAPKLPAEVSGQAASPSDLMKPLAHDVGEDSAIVSERRCALGAIEALTLLFPPATGCAPSRAIASAEPDTAIG
jgi:hypothetical protein